MDINSAEHKALVEEVNQKIGLLNAVTGSDAFAFQKPGPLNDYRGGMYGSRGGYYPGAAFDPNYAGNPAPQNYPANSPVSQNVPAYAQTPQGVQGPTYPLDAQGLPTAPGTQGYPGYGYQGHIGASGTPGYQNYPGGNFGYGNQGGGFGGGSDLAASLRETIYRAVEALNTKASLKGEIEKIRIGNTASGSVLGSGAVAGGTSVVFNGSGFTGATSVTFGGVKAQSYVVNSDTQVTAISPAHAAGTVDVVVTSPSGASKTSTFTYA